MYVAEETSGDVLGLSLLGASLEHEVDWGELVDRHDFERAHGDAMWVEATPGSLLGAWAAAEGMVAEGPARPERTAPGPDGGTPGAAQVLDAAATSPSHAGEAGTGMTQGRRRGGIPRQ